MPIFDDRRDAWDARSPRSGLTYVGPSQRSEFFSHWDGGSPVGLFGKPHTACLAKVRQDQGFHMNSNGWSDIGYNGLICPHGRCIEGRGIDVAGAHCPNHNTQGYGFQFMIGKGEKPNDLMLARARRLYDDLSARGRTLAKRGHRDGFATECPGAEIYAWVKAGMPSPSTKPPVPEEEDVTPEDIEKVARRTAELVLGADVIKAPKADPSNPTWTVQAALEWSTRASILASDRSQAAVAGIQAMAKSLPADVAADVLAALSKDYDASVNLTPKES